MSHEGDSLEGLVIRYRAAHEEWNKAYLHMRAMDLAAGPRPNDYTPGQRRSASERIGAAARVRFALEDEILKRLREGGTEINAAFHRYFEETGR